jgi:hypothetical protein
VKSLPLLLLILALLSVTTIVTVTFFVPPIYSEFKFEDSYKNHDGNTITADQYKQRLASCWSMKFKNMIPLEDSDVDCRTWVLSEEGEAMIYKYVINKALED